MGIARVEVSERASVEQASQAKWTQAFQVLLPVCVVKVNSERVVNVVIGGQRFWEDDNFLFGAAIFHLIKLSMISFCLL